jgi:hypothetical protein
MTGIVIPDGGTIGSASDTDAISIASDGQVTFSSNTLATQSEVFGTHTTGSITASTTALTVSSGSGISNGDFVVGRGITPGTTVSSGGGTTSITLSANANQTLSSEPVMFYTSTKLLSPGLVGGMLCRAWINFDGTSTPAVRASGNVSSITDNGTGDYTVSFTTAMPDNDYTVTGIGRHYAGVSEAGVIIVIQTSDGATGVTTSSVRISTMTSNTTLADSPIVSVAIFR